MYKKLIEYQKDYFDLLFDVTELDFGYFTQSADLEYINSNSIIVTEVTDDSVASVCSLLATNIHTTKIQFPRKLIDFGDEDDTLYLVEYTHQNKPIRTDVSIELVTEQNYQQFIELSNKLQVQEYGELYKQQANADYLNQNQYQLYVVKVGDELVGEFIYIPQLFALESIIILKQYQRQGVASSSLELITNQNKVVYLSADNSSIKFYERINAKIIDCYEVKNLYGSSRNILMYISLCI